MPPEERQSVSDAGLRGEFEGGFFAGLAAALAGGPLPHGAGAHPGPPQHEVFAVIDTIFGARFYEDARGHAMREMGLDGSCPMPEEVRMSFCEKVGSILEAAPQQQAGRAQQQANNTARLDLVRLCLCAEVLRHIRGPARGATATPRPIGSLGHRAEPMDLIFVMGGPRGGAGGMMLIGLSGTGSLHNGAHRLDPRFLQERVGTLLEALLMADSRLARPAGLTTQDMDRHCPVGPRVEQDDGCCPVCLEPSTTGEEVRKLPCGHMLHRECCEAWLTNADTCPTCRFQIPRAPPSPRLLP